MCAPKDSKEKLEWASNSSNIGKTVEKARMTVGSNERIKFGKRAYRRILYITDLNTAYWNFGSMTDACQLCKALHYFGEKNSQPGSSLLYSKFSEYWASGQITSHFLLDSLCKQCRMPFNESQNSVRHPLPEEVCNSCSYVVPKILPVFQGNQWRALRIVFWWPRSGQRQSLYGVKTRYDKLQCS